MNKLSIMKVLKELGVVLLAISCMTGCVKSDIEPTSNKEEPETQATKSDGNESKATQSDDEAKNEQVDPKDEEKKMIDYERLVYLAEYNLIQDIKATITRTDENLIIENSRPSLINEILALQLSTEDYGIGAELDKPFTIEMELAQGQIRFDFITSGKVMINGDTEMYIGSQEGLDEYLKYDFGHFYTGNHFKLKQELPFECSDVTSIDVNRGHYTENITVQLNSKEAIEALFNQLGNTDVYKVSENDDVGIAKAAGGAPFIETTFNLNNGKQVILTTKGAVDILSIDGNITEYVPVGMNEERFSTPVYMYPFGYTMSEIKINDQSLKLLIAAYDVAGDTMINEYDIERILQYNEAISLTGDKMTCLVDGDDVKLYVQRVGEDTLTELPVSNKQAELPTEAGSYLLKAVIKYKDGSVTLVSNYGISE